MNVVVFGASGGIGKHAVKHALSKGYYVTAHVRNASKLNMSNDRLRVVEGEILDYCSVLKAVQGQDAVIWCVGIPMKRKYGRMESFEGHNILLAAMKKEGVARLIDWGTPSISFEKDKTSFITVVPGIMAGLLFKTAKREMVLIGDLLKNSDLDWTIVRFMAPKDSPYRGGVKVGFGDVKMRFSVSREDIGAFMVDQVEDGRYIKSMPIIGS